MIGAGGSEGGLGKFFLGLIMFIGGSYLLLTAIQVSNHFNWGYNLFSMGGLRVTSGFLLIPFMIGVGMIFFNARNYVGWFLLVASIVMLILGVITSIDFQLRTMNAFELLMILTLMIGGLGLFLSSLRSSAR